MTTLPVRSILAALRDSWQRTRRTAELRALVRAVNPCCGELMPWRLRQLGMDPQYVRIMHTASYRELEQVCRACTAWEACAYDLARGRVQAGMRSYCLTAHTIETFNLDRSVPRA